MKAFAILSIAGVAASILVTTSAEANCPYYSRPIVHTRPVGAEVRRWVTNTTTEWRDSSFAIEIFPGADIERNQQIQVPQIHTQFWQAEVISQSASVQCEVIGHVPETIPGDCTYGSQRQQQQTCTPTQTVDRPIYGWKTYPELSEIRDLPPRESVISTRDFTMNVQVKGQILQAFERELLHITVDENGSARPSWTVRYNNYGFDQAMSGRNQTNVVLNGRGRDMASARPTYAQLFRQAPQLIQDPRNPNRIYIKLEVAPEVFHAEGNPEAKFKITYQAWQSPSRMSSDFRLLPQNATRSVYMAPGSRYIEIDIYGMGTGRPAQVKMFLNIENSKWYQAGTIELPTLSAVLK